MILTAFILVAGAATLLEASQDCLFEDLLEHVVVTCTDTDLPILPRNDVVFKKENTTCLTITSNSSHYVSCIRGFWQSEDGSKTNSYENTALVQRFKRGFFSSIGHFFHKVGHFFHKVGHAVAKGFVCVSRLLNCVFGHHHRPGPPPDTTKPVLACPPLISAIAEPFQTFAIVHWTEPVAHDNVDGTITPVRQGKGPYYAFGETSKSPPHIVKYFAKDRTGNSQTCELEITVRVIRCQPPVRIPNGYFICHPSTDFVLSGWCSFGCYDGFELAGASYVNCTEQGIWSKSWPKCKPLTCPALRPIDGASLDCSNVNNFRSVCSYNCEAGYDMPHHVSKALVCTNRKTWRKHGEPKCKDIESPTFEACPSTIIRGTEAGRTTGKLVWTEPKVKDNSGQLITPKLSANSPDLGSSQQAGTYKITYSAYDAEGNSAMDCSFKVIIKDVRCPRLYPTPNMHISCPHGYRTNAFCTITCEPGTMLMNGNGSVNDFVGCRQDSNGLFGTWDWKENMPFCVNTHKCPHLKPPKNGAIVCDNWDGGEYCQYQCQQGYDSYTDWKTLTVCQQSGRWNPHIDPFNCALRSSRIPHTFLQIKAEYYYHGSCTNDTTKQEIEQHFIQALNTSQWSTACLNEPKCSVGHVQVLCGATDAHRYRREIRGQNITTYALSIIKIGVQLEIFQDLNSSFTDIQRMYTGQFIQIKALFHDLIAMPSLDGLNISLKQVTNDGIHLLCPDGSIRAADSFGCILCPEGSYFDKTTRRCHKCQKGSYQDGLGQLACIECPKTKTTRGLGSSSDKECEDACQPGMYSKDGIVPCSPCEVGYYQHMYGQSRCSLCPGSTSTLSVGYSAKSDCKEFDIEFPYGLTKTVSLQLHEPAQLGNFHLSLWMQINNVTQQNISISLLNKYGAYVANFDKLRYVKLLNNSFDLYQILEMKDERWHKVAYELQDCTVTLFKDGVPVYNTTDPALCGMSHSLQQLQIQADELFDGTVSQINIGSPTTRRIVSDARCFHKFSGDLVSWQVFSGADMTGAYVNTPSECDGFDNCLSSPCTHGSCKDAINGFICSCDGGFTGVQCDVNIDDCNAHVCMNNATCVDGVMGYTCACAGNETGQYCEIEMVDGEWGSWSNWSDCSTTCGPGQRKRFRLCDNPTPDNGGAECVGNDEDIVACNNTACPTCPDITVPDNGTATCINGTDSINCTIACNEGFDFDIEPLDFYHCGAETNYEWNYQTVINPLRRLPTCTEITQAEKLSVRYDARYMNLYCYDSLKQAALETVKRHVEDVVNKVPCIQTKMCSFKGFEIFNCDGNIRKKRSQDTASFSLVITTTPSQDGDTKHLDSLQDAFLLIQGAADEGTFTVDILNNEYLLDSNQTELSGDVKCPPGMTRSKHYCVPCGEGAYLYEDYCKKCDIGYYQHSKGQTSCTQCPEDRSTVGIGSTTLDDCTVQLDTKPTETEITTIAVCCSLATAGCVVLALFIYRRKRVFVRKKKSFSRILPDMNTPGPTKPAPMSVIELTDSISDSSDQSKSFEVAKEDKSQKDTPLNLSSLAMFGLGKRGPSHHLIGTCSAMNKSIGDKGVVSSFDMSDDSFEDVIKFDDLVNDLLLDDRTPSRMTDVEA